MFKLSRVLLLLVLSVALCSGIYVPPHVPMQEVAPVAEFEVPWWLGGFVAVTNETSGWILPLTYVNGGKTNTGTTLVIQNRGPFNITLFASAPETIQGLASYLVVADSTVQFLSATDWVVVSATFGDEGMDGIFGYLQAENASVACWLGVGTNNPANKQCGDLTTARLFVTSNASAAIGPNAGQLVAARDTTTLTSGTVVLADFSLTANPGSSSAASYRPLVFGLTITDGNTQTLTAGSIGLRGAIAHGGGSVTNGLTNTLLSVVYTSSFVSPSVVANSVTLDVTPGSASGTPTGTITNNFGIRIQNPAAGSGPLVSGVIIGLDISAFTPAATFAIGLRIAAPTAATTRVALQLSDTGSTTAGGIAWGNFEFNTYRCAANVLCNSGSQRVATYQSLGSLTAPTNVAAGAFSTTKATPTLQAFGAVVANAASGLLSFTVSTAAVTCATAVITNTNVVAGSEVILTIQSYTGTLFTNGFPIVMRSDTSGSSAGSFTLQLCNTHATNALSGNLFIAFWVLN